MTITNEGIEYLIETPRYHYLEYKDGVLHPKSIIFKGLILGKPYIQDLRFIDWVGMMLNNKIIVASDEMPEEHVLQIIKDVSILKDPLLVVDHTNIQYITQTLFTIANHLLEEGSKLKSLEWVE